MTTTELTQLGNGGGAPAEDLLPVRCVADEYRIAPVFTIAQAIQRRKTLVDFTGQLMVAGVDYGIIPGTGGKDAKPSLLKPGAEKLVSLFGLTPRGTLVERIEDWTGADHGGETFLYYIYRTGLWRGDLLIAEADGSCNSWEKKYRYRKAQRTCPKCGAAAIQASKFGEGGFYCFNKIGGCGAKFGPSDASILSQESGQMKNPDIPELANTILKMAQKRALVAATLVAVNASEFFTQDIEDLPQFADVVDAEFADAPHEPEPARRNAPKQQVQQPAAAEPQPAEQRKRKLEYVEAVKSLTKDDRETLSRFMIYEFGTYDYSKLSTDALGIGIEEAKGLAKSRQARAAEPAEHDRIAASYVETRDAMPPLLRTKLTSWILGTLKCKTSQPTDMSDVQMQQAISLAVEITNEAAAAAMRDAGSGEQSPDQEFGRPDGESTTGAEGDDDPFVDESGDAAPVALTGNARCEVCQTPIGNYWAEKCEAAGWPPLCAIHGKEKASAK